MIHHTIKHRDIFPDEEVIEPVAYITRRTVKGIIFDQQRRIVLVTKKGSGFYFLPGGEVEEGGMLEQALKMECLEEIGANIEIVKKFATVSEYRTKSAELYETSCLIADIAREEGEPDLMEEDRMFGMDTKWIIRAEAMDILKAQLKKINNKTQNYYNRKFNTARDLFFIEKSLI